MAEPHNKLMVRFWRDTKGWGERNQNVALYILTGPHRTMEGLYHLPLGYLCADLGLKPKEAEAAITFAADRGLIAYDAVAEVVFVRKALKHSAPRTPNHVTGAVRRLALVPWCDLWTDFLMACECHADALAHAIRMEWPDRFVWHGDGRTRADARSLRASSNSNSSSSSIEREGEARERPKRPSEPGRPTDPASTIDDQHVVAVVAVLRTAPRLQFDPLLASVTNTIAAYPDADHIQAAHVAVANVSDPNYRTTDAGKALRYAIQELERSGGRRGNRPAPAPTPATSERDARRARRGAALEEMLNQQQRQEAA